MEQSAKLATNKTPEEIQADANAERAKLVTSMTNLDKQKIRRVKSLQDALRRVSMLESVLAMNQMMRVPSSGEPSDIYNLLPTKLQGINIHCEAMLIRKHSSGLSSAERRLVKSMVVLYNARFNAKFRKQPVPVGYGLPQLIVNISPIENAFETQFFLGRR